MPTQKQRDANIRNSQQSTGPRSPEGKSTSALNAFKHGFCAEDATLHDDPETAEQIAARATRYFDHYLPVTPFEEATLRDIAFCEVRLDHLVRAETGLLNFHRQLAFQHNTFANSSGDLFHKFDPVNHPPGDERHVANMLLGVAWRDAGPEIDRMSRYESRLRVRYEKAMKRLDTLRATRPQPQQQSQPEPAPPPQPQPQPEPAPPPQPQPDPPPAKPPAPETRLLPNEPNFDLKPVESVPVTPKSTKPAPAAINPVNKEAV